MEYTIINKKQVVLLIIKVNELLEQGWVVSGGASYGVYGFIQAMTKEDQISFIEQCDECGTKYKTTIRYDLALCDKCIEGSE